MCRRWRTKSITCGGRRGQRGTQRRLLQQSSIGWPRAATHAPGMRSAGPGGPHGSHGQRACARLADGERGGAERGAELLGAGPAVAPLERRVDRRHQLVAKVHHQVVPQQALHVRRENSAGKSRDATPPGSRLQAPSLLPHTLVTHQVVCFTTPAAWKSAWCQPQAHEFVRRLPAHAAPEQWASESHLCDGGAQQGLPLLAHLAEERVGPEPGVRLVVAFGVAEGQQAGDVPGVLWRVVARAQVSQVPEHLRATQRSNASVCESSSPRCRPIQMHGKRPSGARIAVALLRALAHRCCQWRW